MKAYDIFDLEVDNCSCTVQSISDIILSSYFSLSSLTSFPLDKLKIRKFSFVDGLDNLQGSLIKSEGYVT